MTTELDRLAANAPDNTEGAMVRWLATTHNTLNAQLASGVMTDEQYTEALGQLRHWPAPPRKRLSEGSASGVPTSLAHGRQGCWAVSDFFLLIVIAIAVLWLA